MTSKTSICNLALAYLGQSPISSLEQENEQARWLKLFYEPVRDEVLRTHNWAFASAWQPLVLVAEKGGEFIYKYPVGALFIRRIVSPQDSHTPLTFTERFDTQQHMRVLVVPVAGAIAHYTRRITDETQYDASFVKCFALALACDTALALTGDIDLAARMQQKYTLYVEEARRNNMSENGMYVPQTDSFSEVR